MTLRIAVLLSLGRHPGSGRNRVAVAEGSALALAASLPEAHVTALHAGQASAVPVLEDCLGMGAGTLEILEIPAGADPLPALVKHLAETTPHVILCGKQTEQGETGGMIPYLLAEALNLPLVEDIVTIEAGSDRLTMTRALSGGHRLRLSGPAPLVLVVGRHGPPQSFPSLGGRRAGTVRIIPAGHLAETDDQDSWRMRPARQRPKRLSAPTRQSGAGAETLDIEPEKAARRILEYLQDEGLLPPVAPADAP